MSFNKNSFEESLAMHVIDVGKCLGCGACIITCPFNCLDYVEEKPRLIKKCEVCGICAQVCPQNEWALSKVENLVFGRERKTEEDFGVFRKLAIAKARNEKILKVCQDGGVVTALLSFALENKLIDCAIVAGISKEKPFCSTPKLAKTSEDILNCAGTKYSYSPNILAFAEAIKQKNTNVAFVGTPCQIRAIRKIQITNLKKYTAPLKFLIGLMCSECFTYEGLMEKHIHGKMGIDLGSIRKMNIKGKMLVTTDSGVTTIPLLEIKQYARKSCSYCEDFSSELSDISVGGLGLDGWTFTIIRTEKGEELFSSAEKAGLLDVKTVETETNALNLLNKLSKKKREKLTTFPKNLA